MKENRLGGRTTDMTEGSPFRLLLGFAVPVMLGNLFQNLYNLADMAIAGHTIGDAAIAAISSTSALYSIVQTVAHGMNAGNAIIVAQMFGGGNLKRARDAYAAMLELAACAAVVLTALFLGLLPVLMRLINTPPELLADATRYIVIILCGLVVMIFYNLYAALLHALGDTRTPLYFLIFSALVNIALDFLLMAVLRLGVTGAAAATVAAQLISVTLCVRYVSRRYPQLKLTRADLKPDRSLIGRMLPMGVSAALTNSLFAIGSFAVQGTVNSFGTAYITAFAAGNRIRGILCNISPSLSNACTTFAAQNYGAGKYRRIDKGIWSSIFLTFLFNIVMCLFVWTLGGPAVRLVTGTTDPAVVENAVLFMKIVVPFIVVQNLVMSFRMSIQGMGGKVIPMIGTGIELVARCFCAWVMADLLGFPGVCLGEPMSWVTSGLVMMLCYFPIRRKKERLAAGAV